LLNKEGINSKGEIQGSQKINSIRIIRVKRLIMRYSNYMLKVCISVEIIKIVIIFKV